MKEIVAYIITFLLGKENKAQVENISYGVSERAKVIIQKSDFFDEEVYLTEKSIPDLPLKEMDGVPILFGENYVEKKNGQLIIHADLVASTFFLISRYEECVRRTVRDKHGRFIGKESTLYKAGILDIPVVELYGELLRKYLKEMGAEVQEPKTGFSYIYLTHDVDKIWTWDNYFKALKTCIRRVVKREREKLQPLKSVFNYKKYDPCYTFDRLVIWDKQTIAELGEERCQDTYFFKACEQNNSVQDAPYWNKNGREKAKELVQFLKENKSEIGLHISYDASLERRLIKDEKQFLEKEIGEEIKRQRNHYLASREPEDFQILLELGIKEDFTMSYADVAGFRLGTCRSVRWINPITKELTDLILHPMTIMECTLDAKEYMNIQEEEEAFRVIKHLVDQVYKYDGEIVYLWHNQSVSDSNKSYRKRLYYRALTYLVEVQKN